LNFGIELRWLVKRGGGCVLQIDVKERVHILGSDGEPAAPVQAAESKYAQQPDDVMALEQHLVAETKVIRPANGYE
jgi:hypothetical protein